MAACEHIPLSLKRIAKPSAFRCVFEVLNLNQQEQNGATNRSEGQRYRTVVEPSAKVRARSS